MRPILFERRLIAKFAEQLRYVFFVKSMPSFDKNMITVLQLSSSIQREFSCQNILH